MAEAASQWIRNIFIEIGLPHIIEQPISIGCDNQSAIRMVVNLVLHERTKHIEGTCHFIRDYIKKNRIKLHFVNTRDQQVDILTKALPHARFIQLRKLIGMMTKEEFEAFKTRDLLTSILQAASKI